MTNNENNAICISLGTLGLFIDNIVSFTNGSSGVVEDQWKMKSTSFDTSAAVTEGNKEWETFSNDRYTVRKDANEVAYMPCHLKLGDRAERMNSSCSELSPLRELSGHLSISMDENKVDLAEQWMKVIGGVDKTMAVAACCKTELGKMLSILEDSSKTSTGGTRGTYLHCMDMFRNIGSMRISINTSDLGSQGRKISERIIGCVLKMAGLEEMKMAKCSPSRTSRHSLPFHAKNFDACEVYWKKLQMCFQAKLYLVQVYEDVLQVVKCMSSPAGGVHSILDISSLGQRSRYVLPRMKN